MKKIIFIVIILLIGLIFVTNLVSSLAASGELLQEQHKIMLDPTPTPAPPTTYTEPVSWPIKGAAFPGYYGDSYAQPNAKDLVDYLIESGVNTIQIVPSWFQNDMESNDIAPGVESPTDESIRDIIQYIHDQDAQVMLKPHLESHQGWTGTGGGWRGVISPTNPISWFNSYEAFIMNYAQIAEDEGVEMFVIGTEMASMTQGEANQAKWIDMLGSVRSVYSGEVMYAAHEYGVVGGHYREPVSDSVPAEFEMTFVPLPPSFWQHFDYAATTVYYNIYSSTLKTPSIELLIEGWYNNDAGQRPHEQEFLVDEITQWQADHGKPVIFAEIGYRSIDYCAYQPFIAAPGEPNGPGLSADYNDQCQANAYEAALTIWGGKPWLAGAFWWQFIPKVANARECGEDVDPAAEVSYTPCGRPAAEVMSRWYDGSNQPPDPLPAYVPDLPLVLPFDSWNEQVAQRALRPQTSGIISFTLDQDIYLPEFSQSLQMTSTLLCTAPRYGQLDFTFTTPQDFSQYNSIVITAHTRDIDQGELSVILIDADGEEWQSTRWFEGSEWQTFKIALAQGEEPEEEIPIDNPWAHPADFVIPEWATITNNLTLNLTQTQAIRFKTVTVDSHCEQQPQMVAWFGNVHLSQEVVTPPVPVTLPAIDKFNYAAAEELNAYWQVVSTSGETSIGLESDPPVDNPPALYIDNDLPCDEGRHALIMRKFLRPVDLSSYTHLTLSVSGDGLLAEPYGGEFSVALWDAGSNEGWEEWQSSRWYVRHGGWQTFTIRLQDSGIGDPWEHPNDFVITTTLQNGQLDLDKVAAIGIKANTTNGNCAAHPTSLVLVDDILVDARPLVTVLHDGDDIVLQWDSVLNADSYRVYRSQTPQFTLDSMPPGSTLYADNVTTLDYRDVGAAGNDAYFYVVTAVTPSNPNSPESFPATSVGYFSFNLAVP